MAAPMIKSSHSIQTQSGMNLDYVMYMPDGLSGKLPLVFSLHGAGERGKNIDLVEIHGFPKQAKAGTDFPFIVKNSLDAFEILEPINPNVHLTIYEGIGHDSWTETYQNPDVLDWMLSQRNQR